MRITRFAIAVLTALTLQACEDPDQYPVSGDACSPDDPVHDISVEACKPPA